MSDDDDMFADLEQTLCEGLNNLRFTRNNDTINTSLPEIDVSCLEDTSNLSKINGPAVRTYNLYKATKAYQNKQYLESIYYETFALSLYIRIKFHANKIMESEHHMPTEDNLANFLEEKQKQRPEIIDYIDRFLRDALDKDDCTDRLRTIEFENGTELMKLCSQLPEEWTVIQLCKQVNTEVFLQSRDETLKHPGVIFLTLFRYPMSERFDHQPIKIALNQKDLNELYKSTHGIFTKLEADSLEFFRTYTNGDFDEQIVSKMKKLLGPWIVCLSGKRRSANFENGLIREVDRLLATSEHKYSKRQNTLICLIARRIYMLTEENIKEAAYYIANTKYEFWELIEFFEDLKVVCKETELNCYPVILIVDEHIDFMFWEMCNLDQEFTRVDSMVTLLKLYFHHQDNMRNGYFNVKGNRGSAVINPDRTLPQFTQHVHPFLKNLPNTTWNFLIDKEPTFSDLRGFLANSDVYVYCGHGSGVQFISAYETCKLTTNAVVFLMGCSSVAFRANHGYSMASASHHYYHIAKSPAVIGHLNLAYTNTASVLLNVMLAKWFSNVTDADPKLFNELGKNFSNKMIKAVKVNGPDSINQSVYLSNVISQLRKRGNIGIVFRAILCHRGLPVRMESIT